MPSAATSSGVHRAHFRFPPPKGLEEHIKVDVRRRLAPYEYSREIEFIDQLPMTTTGKVQRRVLRLREEERRKKAA
jgi:acetyl-CoA synthetase